MRACARARSRTHALAHTRARAHARTHARARTHAHAHPRRAALFSALAASLPTPPALAAPTPANTPELERFEPVSDLFYPDAFEGRWEVESVLTSAEALSAASEAAVKQALRTKGAAVRYGARWLRVGGGGGVGGEGEGRVVLDRGYTSAGLLEATLGEGLVLDVQWEPDVPRELRMSLGRGLGSVELRVLSCAQRRPAASGAFETRELSAQVVTADAAGEDGRAARTRALPSVCLSKYKWEEEEEGRQVRVIEAAQRVAVFDDALGDAAAEASLRALADAGAARQPAAVYRYELRLTRRA